jgi:Lrp/AsnC family transcriptional regulator, leucine-responsive regulatory protein
MPNITLVRIDYRILHHLQNDARMTNSELADAVGLTP